MHQRTEQEIMYNWKGNPSKPVVSICTITYNHEFYIVEAIDSFLMQETDFPFEIVIDDDYSQDATGNVIKKYMEKYPNIIKANLRKRNVGAMINATENMRRAKGEYIAICEGDDYWTDKNKLQIQVNVLKKNKEIDLCIHKALRINVKNKEELEIGNYLDDDGIVPIENIILKSKGQIPTASTIYRKKILEQITAFQNQRPWLTVGDIYIHFFGSKRGGAYFINKIMSVYRLYSEGSWTTMYQVDYKERLIHANCRIRSYEELDTIEMYRFTSSIRRANKKSVLEIIKGPKIPYFDKILFTFKNRRYLSLEEKITYYGLVLIPFSFYLRRYANKKFLKKLLNMHSK